MSSPKKLPTSKENTSPPVRQYTATRGTPPPGPSTTTAAPPPTKKATRKLTQEARAGLSPRILLPSTPKTREAEAKSWFFKGHAALTDSRNLRGDLKEALKEALNNLQRLYREAERAAECPTTTGVENVVEETVLEVAGKEDIMKRLEEQSTLLRENGKKIEELREVIIKHEVHNSPTYASVAAAPPQGPSPVRSALHSVIITSRDDQDTAEEVLNRVRKAVNRDKDRPEIEKVRKGRDRKVIVGVRTQEDRRKMADKLRDSGENLVVEEAKNKDPLLVIRGVISALTDEEVMTALRNNNGDVFRGLDEEEARISVKFRKKARNPHTNHVVVSTSPTVWNRALAKGRLRVDLQPLIVQDQSPLVQCTRCLAYGHSKRLCKEHADLCSHCGGLHLKKDCPEQMAGVPPACKNCTRANAPQAEHNTFSEECPIRRKWDALARAAVAYC